MSFIHPLITDDNKLIEWDSKMQQPIIHDFITHKISQNICKKIWELQVQWTLVTATAFVPKHAGIKMNFLL